MTPALAQCTKPTTARCVVHVLDGASLPDIALLACKAVIEQSHHNNHPGSSSDTHAVVMLGNHTHTEHARRLGLPVDATILNTTQPILAWRSLRSFIANNPCDCLQPWNERTVTLCKLASANIASVCPLLATDHRPSSAHQSTLPAKPDFSTIPGDSKTTIRTRYGVGHDQPMVALLADPPWHADARRFVFMIGILDVAEQPIAGLIDSRSAHLTRARRFHREAAVRWDMRIITEPLCTVLHACDVAVIVPPEPHRPLTAVAMQHIHWSIQRAHQLGVPVVCDGAYFTDQLCPPCCFDHLAAADGSVTVIAKTLANITHDPQRRAHIAAKLIDHLGMQTPHTSSSHTRIS